MNDVIVSEAYLNIVNRGTLVLTDRLWLGGKKNSFQLHTVLFDQIIETDSGYITKTAVEFNQLKTLLATLKDYHNLDLDLLIQYIEYTYSPTVFAFSISFE